MKAIILLRMPVDMNEQDPQLAALRMLGNIIEHGISALRHEYRPLNRWTVNLNEDSGDIELRDR